MKNNTISNIERLRKEVYEINILEMWTVTAEEDLEAEELNIRKRVDSMSDAQLIEEHHNLFPDDINNEFGRLRHACGCVSKAKYNGSDDAAEFLINIQTSFCPECQEQVDAQEEQELEKLLDAYEKSMREADERRGAFCNACNYDAESPQWNCNKCIETQDKYVPLITPRKEIAIRRDVYYECQCCGAKHMTDTLCCGYTACEKVVVEKEYELCHKCGGDTMWDIPCVCDDLAEADLSRLVLGLPSMEVIKDDDDGLPF